MHSDRTKRLLADSLITLIKAKPLVSVTISDIAVEAKVNRQTFYYHFKDIYDLIEWIFKEEAHRIICSMKDFSSWQEGAVFLCKFIIENKELCFYAYNSAGRPYILKLIYDEIFELIYKLVKDHPESARVAEDKIRFIAHFYTLAFSGLLEEWVKTGLRQDPSDILKDVQELMRGNIRTALERYTDKADKK